METLWIVLGIVLLVGFVAQLLEVFEKTDKAMDWLKRNKEDADREQK